MVNGRVGSAGCRRQAARFDDGRATLAHGGQEDIGVPFLVVDHVFHALPVNGGEAVIGIHGGGVVAPDSELFDVFDRLARFFGNLAGGAVVIQPQHGSEVLGRQIGGRFHGDVGIGVGGVANHEHFHVAAGDGVQRLALSREDLRIGGQQVGAFHAGAARARAHQQGVIRILEGRHRIRMCLHACQQRESAVLQLHHHALEGLLGFFIGNFKQLQDDRLIFAQHFARSDAKQKGIANLACCASHGNTDGFFAHIQESPVGWFETRKGGCHNQIRSEFNGFAGFCPVSYIRYD